MKNPWIKNYSEELLNSPLPNSNLYGYLKERNKENLDKVAIIYFNKKITYKELFSSIDKCASALSNLGVNKGDVVTMCTLTTPELIYLFYAINKLGAVANIIDPRKSNNEIKDYTNKTGSNVFIGIDLFNDKYDKVECKHIIQLSLFESIKIKKIMMSFKVKKKYMSYSDLMKLAIKDVENTIYEKALIVHTGGTTGNSKGVILTNDNINITAYQCFYSGLNFKDKGIYLNIMPPFISYGITNSLHLALSNSMTLIVIPKFDPKKFDEVLLKYKPNYLTGVPSYLVDLLRSDKLKGKDLSFLKVPIVGGDKIDRILEEKINVFFKEHNVNSKIIKGYGMTEVSASACVCVNDDVNVIGSVGVPLPFTTITVNDVDTGKVLFNEIGEIRISGPNVMYGYVNKVDEEEIVHYDKGIKTIYTKDYGKMDDEGRLFVMGRYKDVIILESGFKVFPNEVEKVIENYSDVAHSEVIGYKDDTIVSGEKICAFISLNKGANKDDALDKIKQLCNDNLSTYSIPHKYVFLDDFPRTSIGKTDNMKLKKMLEDGKF